MRTLCLVGILAVISSPAFAQTSSDQSTKAGHDLNVSFGGYKYTEPLPDTPISIHGFKFGGEYTGTFLVGSRWFVQGNARITSGNVTYDGWCSPYMIIPDGSSPNGWRMTIGDASPCSDTGNSDWYFETRGLAGKDFGSSKLVWAPYAGIGYRHLSNGTTGTPGFRKDDYVYVPLGVTVRTAAGSHALSLNAEYDLFIRGWQNTYNTLLGGGTVPATPTAPAFTIEGLSDLAFDQHSGWGLRTSAKYHITDRWSIEPYYIHWNVADSPVSVGTIDFTVNGVTVSQQYGAYEPHNLTHEYGVKIGIRF